MNKVFKN